MWAALAFFSGVACAGIVLAVFRVREPGSADPVATPTALGWTTLAFGVAAAAALVSALLFEAALGVLLASIACATAAVIIGVGAVLRRDRHWPTWVGLAAGVIPGVLWLAFVIGNLLGLGD